MKIVNLHGKLAEKFGSRWELEINSISEALRAINANTGDFFDYLSEKQEENKTFSFILEDCKQKIETVEEILTPLPKKCTEFHIMPNAEGGMAEIAVPLAISVITGVIMRALFKPPKPEEEKQSKSFLFGGAENVASQGVAVPLGYGRLLVGSVVVSATMRHVDRNNVDFQNSNSSDIRQHVTYNKWPKNLSRFTSQDNSSSMLERVDPKGVFSLGGGDD